MKNEEFFEKRREIGPAIHLIVMYWAASKLEKWPWFVVMDGDSLTDAEAAAFLGISMFTAVRWRQRLMRNGFVQAERCGSGYRIRVQRPPFAMASVRTLRAHAEARDPWAHMATELVQ